MLEGADGQILEGQLCLFAAERTNGNTVAHTLSKLLTDQNPFHLIYCGVITAVSCVNIYTVLFYDCCCKFLLRRPESGLGQDINLTNNKPFQAVSPFADRLSPAHCYLCHNPSVKS
uniref:Uncharacterized protein n=1 Tax=Sphaerodactylus townsendi TaxID=933632 RepID=A0ACB8EFK0_9SAUR